MSTEDHGERIAVLESKVDTFESNIEQILNNQTKMLSELSRYKGAIGMVMFLITCFIAGVELFKEFVVAHWK